MSDRRNFVKQLGVAAGAFGAQSIFSSWQQQSGIMHIKSALPTGDGTVENEEYWSIIQQAYTANGSIINLNNGGVSPQPIVVQQALNRYNDLASQAPSYYMWRIIDQGREQLRARLAQLSGVHTDEIAINRNTTEGLNTIIYGLPLQKGDEVIGTVQDYPNMIQAYQQRMAREGIVYKQISFDFPIENDATIVKAFEAAITPNTKLLHITHIINWVGQIMPVRKIADMAHAKGIEVIVDGAHSFGLLNFKIPDLGADYFATSLHKFLCAPVGSGMMYIKADKIAKVWPLLCNSKPQSNDIRKFETLGTRSFCIEQAIGEAINFHEGIGASIKENRIRYLKNYWAEQLKDTPRVKLHTSLLPAYSCAIAGVSIEGIEIVDTSNKLFANYKIHTTGINWENIHCVRVTPNVYTRTQDLDRLVKAIKEIAKNV